MVAFVFTGPRPPELLVVVVDIPRNQPKRWPSCSTPRRPLPLSPPGGQLKLLASPAGPHPTLLDPYPRRRWPLSPFGTPSRHPEHAVPEGEATGSTATGDVAVAVDDRCPRSSVSSGNERAEGSDGRDIRLPVFNSPFGKVIWRVRVPAEEWQTESQGPLDITVPVGGRRWFRAHSPGDFYLPAVWCVWNSCPPGD